MKVMESIPYQHASGTSSPPMWKKLSKNRVPTSAKKSATKRRFFSFDGSIFEKRPVGRPEAQHSVIKPGWPSAHDLVCPGCRKKMRDNNVT